MALTAAQTTQCFEIFGIPETGTSITIGSIQSIYGANIAVYSHAAAATRMAAILAALTATQITRVTTLLDRWTAITGTAPSKINDDAGSVCADYPAERAAIREQLEKITGIFIGGQATSADNLSIVR